MPWLVDRLFRNLLVDVTGNTHRSEICIDKLYSPDGPTGRLGLVEFRGFEMPPNARMSLAQQVLVRALIARFWTDAARRQVRPLGHAPCTTASCCRTTSGPTSSKSSPISRHHGFDLDPDWFAAQLEFRFPFCGEVEYEGMTLTLNQALEPWHVMGEQGAIGGTVRFVDSSVERLQVKLEGANPNRYAVTCNQRLVPLRDDRPAGIAVAGVRYKAWQPASGMHPKLPVNTPLIFDIYDTLVRPLDRRLRLSRRPPRRPHLRHLPGQRQRSRGPPPRALRPRRPHRRAASAPSPRSRRPNSR